MTDSIEDLIDEAFETIDFDFDEHLHEVDDYLCGRQRDPYVPGTPTAEVQDIMRRSKQNWMPLPVNSTSQALAVDGFRPGKGGEAEQLGSDGLRGLLTDTPEWAMWQRSNMDARQVAVHKAAIAYGQAFVLSELNDDGQAVARPLSPLHTTALYEDVLADDNALFALTITQYPYRSRRGYTEPGVAYAWDRWQKYEIIFGDGEYVHEVVGPHGGNGHNPVTRFVSGMDAEGRVQGSVEPLIEWQDAFNQTLFNQMMTQTDGAFRTIAGTGVSIPTLKDDQGREVLDETGNPKKVPIRVAPGTMLLNDSKDAKFTALAPADMTGYKDALETLVQHFSALSQTPPNFLLGQMANLSADALEAAEKSFRRKVAEYKRQFGEAWERVLRIGMILEGQDERESWEHSEVVWRDFEDTAMSAKVDALTKLAQGLGVPPQALWKLVPGITGGTLDEWLRLAAEMNQQNALGAQLEEWQQALDGSSAPTVAGSTDEVADGGLS